jgi:membrane carboxypeptidase/penicillin-binding protein
MANILRDVIQHGTGRAALKIGRDDLGGKTGTTNDAKDAWFAGFNSKLVSIAWVGFDRPTTLGRREYGGIAALPIWINFMDKSLQGTASSWVQLDKNAKAPISANSQVFRKIAVKAVQIALHHRSHVHFMCLPQQRLLEHRIMTLLTYQVKKF